MTGHEAPDLSDEEKVVLDKLADAWNVFVNLPGKARFDDSEFSQGIHYLQCMVALRVARRADPDVWKK